MSLTMEQIVVQPPEPGELLDWVRLFGNEKPVEVELGTGKGGFLLERARCVPEHNYLGVEWANTFYRFAADRMARWGVDCVRVMRTDASNLVIHHFPAASIAALHVYHPDPWPKRRHQKKRLFQPAFVRAVAKVLQPGSRLFVQTDHAEYFDWIGERVRAESDLRVERAAAVGEKEDEPRPGTNFEVKYRREGRTIYGLTAVRR